MASAQLRSSEGGLTREDSTHLQLSDVGRHPGVEELVLIREPKSDVGGKGLVAGHELDVGGESGGSCRRVGLGERSRGKRKRVSREAQSSRLRRRELEVEIDFGVLTA